jgi:cytochrome b561
MKFGTVRQFFHWVITLTLLGQIPLAWYMIELPMSPDKFATYALHKSIGMTLFTLAVLRVLWALWSSRPALPDTMPRWQVYVSKFVEFMLYLLVIVMPVTGWLMSSAANTPVSVWGWLTLPDLVEPNEKLMETLKLVHETQSIALMTFAGIHVLAALKHHFVDRDNVLLSMLPFVKLHNADRDASL